MKDIASVVGQLGGLSTALFFVLSGANSVLTKKKFASFVNDQRELHKAEKILKPEDEDEDDDDDSDMDKPEEKVPKKENEQKTPSDEPPQITEVNPKTPGTKPAQEKDKSDKNVPKKEKKISKSGCLCLSKKSK